MTPILIEITNKPEYIFSSSEVGTIAYGGSCSSDTVSAITGDNTIILYSSTEIYSGTITVTNEQGESAELIITPFIVETL